MTPHSWQPTVPYGVKGFITVKKGGDAAIYRVGQATVGWLDQWYTVFQNSVGSKPRDAVWNSELLAILLPRRRRADHSLDLFTINELGSFSLD